jgi:NAD(P)-dependent dehydrogenase (short-subunit alcohol dehydrogenase family)
MTTDMGIAGDVAVVTGGASGLGLALGRVFGSRGMRVALLDLDGERAEDEAASLSAAHGVQAFGMAVDVSRSGDLDAAAAAVSERFSRADVVVSNVGVQLFGAVERLTDDEWQWVLDVNVIGAARTARAFLPLLRGSASGRLAFTASSSVLDPGSRMAAYQSSKFALWGLAETLRLELASETVTVSVIFPSGMVTRHLETSAGAQPDHVRREIGGEDDFEAMLASNPGLARDVATPEEVAERVVTAILAGERYIVTHGDIVDGVVARSTELRHAAERARDRIERPNH